jgi:hypothetical protein
MTEMRSEIEVYFRVRGFSVSPEALTVELGMQPTRTWRKGDPLRFGKGTYKDNGWTIGSGLGKSIDLETHVKTLLDKIVLIRENFIKVCTKYHPDLVCVIHSYGGDRPAIPFDREIIKELAVLNASIDIDLYVLDGD